MDLADSPYPNPKLGDLVLRVNAVTTSGTDTRILRGRKTSGIYLAAVLDWFSRRVLSWRVSITLEADF